MPSRELATGQYAQEVRGLVPDSGESGAHARRRSQRRRLVAAATILFGAALFLPPFVLPDFWLYLATLAVIYSISVVGLGVLFGSTGQLCLAQASFMGVGAYTAGLLQKYHPLSPPIELALVVVIGAMVGLLVALPALRVSGLRLALLTLAFGELFEWWVTQSPETTGGPQGLFVNSLAFGEFNTLIPRDGYFFALAFAVVASLLAGRLPRSTVGRAMLAVRDSEAAGQSVGVSMPRTKIAAFVIASTYGAVSGWLLAHHVGAISPNFFSLFPSVYLLVAVILGGAGSVVGAWLGAAYLIFVPELFTSMGMDDAYPIAAGLVLVALVLLAPNGLVAVPRHLAGRAHGLTKLARGGRGT